jgi:hypothetical protein
MTKCKVKLCGTEPQEVLGVVRQPGETFEIDVDPETIGDGVFELVNAAPPTASPKKKKE